jgi:CRP-like cAMP-binding protein
MERNATQGAQDLATWRRLLPLLPPQHYPERHTIFTQGDTPRNVFILARGIVKLTCDLPDGQQSLFARRYPGQILEGCAYGLKLPYPVSATAVIPCEIHSLCVDRMIEAEQGNPDVNA